MASDSNVRHRPGVFKQQNKTHKHGKHKSKGQLERESRGRVSVKAISRKAKKAASKASRKHQAEQSRKNRREEVINRKRCIGGQGSPPHLVAIVPLCEGLDTFSVLNTLKKCDESLVVRENELGTTHISIPRFKQRLAFISPQYGNLHALLDAAKLADSLLFVLSPGRGIDDYGDYCLSCLCAQGLPASIPVVQGLKNVPLKKQGEVKKFLQKVLEKRLSMDKDKLYCLDTSPEALNVLRQISAQKLKDLSLKKHRTHLIAECVSFEASEPQSVTGTLKVTGYLRGSPLDVNSLVHLPGWGDFQLSRIEALDDPYRMGVEKRWASDVEMSESGPRLLQVSDPSLQESLQSEVIPDPMEGEQTWPTEEELAEAEADAKSQNVVKRVPKGTSDYQAAWIMNSDDEGQQEDSDDEDDDDDDMSGIDDDDDADNDDSNSGSDGESENGEEEEFDKVTVTWGDDEKYDAAIDMDEEERALEKYREARSHQLFPDEVDTPTAVPARTRFQRFRGLKSFRTSPWDPKENLPSDYARIFQFENFKRTKKRILAEERDGVQPGWYVTLHVSDVPKSFIESQSQSHPMVLFGLLPHEQKLSVVHFLLKRHPGNEEPIKSKERLIFHVGYRRFTACPIFSQHTNADKFKFERFAPTDGVFVATVYAPIIFPPASVLVFKENTSGYHDLVASGSVLSVRPDRVVVKRVVLSGHPFKINKKSAVVRYMFYNREDIMWFKPVELRTKWGRRGHIKEPLGTHGHMKCQFDGQLKSQDTVLMNLYKRMYPKWTYDPHVPTPITTNYVPESAERDAIMKEVFD